MASNTTLDDPKPIKTHDKLEHSSVEESGQNENLAMAESEQPQVSTALPPNDAQALELDPVNPEKTITDTWKGLSGSAQEFTMPISNAKSIGQFTNPFSINDGPDRSPYNYTDSRDKFVLASSSTPDPAGRFQNNECLAGNKQAIPFEQTPEYHGVNLKPKERAVTPQDTLLPTKNIKQHINYPGADTNNQTAPLPTKQLWFLREEEFDSPKYTSGEIDQMLQELGGALILPPVPAESHALEAFKKDHPEITQASHDQPDKKCLTHLLEHATKDRLNREAIIKTLKIRAKDMEEQMGLLVKFIHRLAEGHEKEMSIEMVEAMQEETTVGKAIKMGWKREEVISDLQMKCDWQQKRARQLQFQEIPKLESKIKALEEAINIISFCDPSGRTPVIKLRTHESQIGRLEGALQEKTAELRAVQEKLDERLALDRKEAPGFSKLCQTLREQLDQKSLENLQLREQLEDMEIAQPSSFPPAAAWNIIHDGNEQQKGKGKQIDMGIMRENFRKSQQNQLPDTPPSKSGPSSDSSSRSSSPRCPMEALDIASDETRTPSLTQVSVSTRIRQDRTAQSGIFSEYLPHLPRFTPASRTGKPDLTEYGRDEWMLR